MNGCTVFHPEEFPTASAGLDLGYFRIPVILDGENHCPPPPCITKDMVKSVTVVVKDCNTGTILAEDTIDDFQEQFDIYL